jgi:hypothetical protein
MKAAFWRYAHQHYHARRPTLVAELAAFTWAGFFILVYAAALVAGWRPDILEALIGSALVATPVAFGFLHRRVRLEAAKAPDALYRKRVATTR